jgi:ADP-heptose:LPS heptosyltransferase
MKILAYRFSAFGDVAMIIPVLKEFLDQNPDAEITFVSRKNFADLFEGIPRVSFKGVNLDSYKGLFGLKKLAEELKDEFNPDLVADLHSVHRSKILNIFFKLYGKKTATIDKGRKEKKQLTQKDNKIKKALKSTPERYADVFRKLGFSLELSHQLPQNTLQKHGVGFAPFAQHETKMLPLEKSLELLKILAKKQPIFLFGGGKHEGEVLNKWEKEVENVTSFAGKLTLKEELKKIAELKVMVSMDSANMHLASLVGTRCISIWGGTHHFAGFLGYGQSEKDIVDIPDLECRPCSIFGKKECFRGDFACLTQLDVSKVLSKI